MLYIVIRASRATQVNASDSIFCYKYIHIEFDGNSCFQFITVGYKCILLGIISAMWITYSCFLTKLTIYVGWSSSSSNFSLIGRNKVYWFIFMISSTSPFVWNHTKIKLHQHQNKSGFHFKLQNNFWFRKMLTGLEMYPKTSTFIQSLKIVVSMLAFRKSSRVGSPSFSNSGSRAWRRNPIRKNGIVKFMLHNP